MKCRKNILMSIMAGVVSCSYCMTASAGTYSDAYMLKRGLLLLESGNTQYRIMDYNTNGDQKANVLDLCRIKSGIIDENKPASQYVSLEAVSPWFSDDKSKITVPVKIKGNTLGVSAVSFTVEYDTWYFELSDVYTSTNDKVSFSKKNDRIQYSVGNNTNKTSEGYLVYLVFDVSPEVPYETHIMELTDIQYAMISNGVAKELSSGECSDYAKLSFEFSRSEVSQNPVTEPAVSTTAKDTTTVKTTTTAKITTAKITASTSPVTEKSEILSFRLDNAELSSDSKNLRIPVYMDMNTGKVGSFSAAVKYDTGKFKLVSVERGDFDGYGYVGGNSDNPVFNMNNGQNISQRSGIIAYLKFEVNNGTDLKTYSFELDNIKVSYYENWNLCEKNDYQKNSGNYLYVFDPKIIITEPIVETTVTSVSTITDRVIETEVSEVTVTSVSETTESQQNSSDYSLSKEQLWFIGEINKFRELNGKSQMRVINKAFKAADERAKMLSESFSVNLPDGRNYKWVLYDNNIMPYCISQSIDNTSTTKESALSTYLSRSSSIILDDSMYDRFAVGHYVDSNGKHYWAMFTFG